MITEVFLENKKDTVYIYDSLQPGRSRQNLNKYKKHHKNKNVPEDKLGHYFIIHCRHGEMHIPYYQYFRLNPPKDKKGNIIKYKYISRSQIDWSTVNWGYSTPFHGPLITDPVWPETGGKWRFSQDGWFIKFPSGLIFRAKKLNSIKNFQNNDNPPFTHSSCKNGEWAANEFGLWQINLANGERHIPL